VKLETQGNAVCIMFTLYDIRYVFLDVVYFNCVIVSLSIVYKLTLVN